MSKITSIVAAGMVPICPHHPVFVAMLAMITIEKRSNATYNVQ